MKTKSEKPLRGLTCTCCGNGCMGRQWWNRDIGFGLCSDCIKSVLGDIPEGYESSCHGKEGVHFFKDRETSKGGFIFGWGDDE